MNKRIGRWKSYMHVNAKTSKWKIQLILANTDDRITYHSPHYRVPWLELKMASMLGLVCSW